MSARPYEPLIPSTSGETAASSPECRKDGHKPDGQVATSDSANVYGAEPSETKALREPVCEPASELASVPLETAEPIPTQSAVVCRACGISMRPVQDEMRRRGRRYRTTRCPLCGGLQAMAPIVEDGHAPPPTGALDARIAELHALHGTLPGGPYEPIVRAVARLEDEHARTPKHTAIGVRRFGEARRILADQLPKPPAVTPHAGPVFTMNLTGDTERTAFLLGPEQLRNLDAAEIAELRRLVDKATQAAAPGEVTRVTRQFVKAVPLEDSPTSPPPRPARPELSDDEYRRQLAKQTRHPGGSHVTR